MDRVNAPDSLWFPCVKHLSEIHNLCSDPNLPNEITPFEARRGITPDISASLQFSFYERVLYLDSEVSWPTTKERSGRWIGVSTNVGDHLTYYILDDQSKQILARSVVRPYTYNFRVKWDPSLSPYPSKRTACHGGDIMPSPEQRRLPTMDTYDHKEPDPSPNINTSQLPDQE